MFPSIAFEDKDKCDRNYDSAAAFMIEPKVPRAALMVGVSRNVTRFRAPFIIPAWHCTVPRYRSRWRAALISLGAKI
jgi:hypothetical protein